jgi:hypothetical protein
MLNAAFGIWGGQKISNDCQAIGARLDDTWRSLRCQPADRDQRQRSDFRAPFLNSLKTLRRPRHGLQFGLIDWTERNVIGFGLQGRRQLGLIVCRYSKLDAREFDRLKIGISKVVLAEMYEVDAGIERNFPAVIENKLAVIFAANVEGASRLRRDFARRMVLDPELHELHAERHDALEPTDVGHDRVEAGQPVLRSGQGYLNPDRRKAYRRRA